MGVRNLDAVSDRMDRVDAASLNQEQANKDAAEQRRLIAESDAEHVAADQEMVGTRSEIEQRFAEAREEIDARYAAKVQRAEEQRVEQHSKNLEKKQDALGRGGLNPDGSDPRSRPQAVVDRDSRRVVEVKA
jgi:hypothetical protein